MSTSSGRASRHSTITDVTRNALDERGRLEEYKHGLRSRLDCVRVWLEFLKSDRPLLVTEEKAKLIEVELEDLSRIVGKLRQAATSMWLWHEEFQAHRRAKISGWERLNLGGAGGWVTFGREVVKRLAGEDRAVAAWAQRVESLAMAAEAVADEARRDLVSDWPTALARHQSGLLGAWRRLVARILRRPVRVPIRVPNDRLSAWESSIRLSVLGLDKMKPAPFDRRLLDQDRR
jgi:hypothetical protein